MARPGSIRVAIIGTALVAVTLAVYAGALAGSFLNFDDDVYVTDNPQVASGLNTASVAWALRSTSAANWHPATWLSHMADVSMFGMDVAGTISRACCSTRPTCCSCFCCSYG